MAGDAEGRARRAEARAKVNGLRNSTGKARSGGVKPGEARARVELTEQRRAKKRRDDEDRRRKQLRARARRAKDPDVRRALEQQLVKPVSEWDVEELARGRPKDKRGGFSGVPPRWVTRQVHEEALRQFKQIAAAEARGLVPLALDTIKGMLLDDRVDDRGKPMTPASVKAQLATWSVEHLLGKPTQRQEVDISVKLQSILGAAMVTPDRLDSGLKDGYRDAIEVQSWDAGEDEPESA